MPVLLSALKLIFCPWENLKLLLSSTPKFWILDVLGSLEIFDKFVPVKLLLWLVYPLIWFKTPKLLNEFDPPNTFSKLKVWFPPEIVPGYWLFETFELDWLGILYELLLVYGTFCWGL